MAVAKPLVRPTEYKEPNDITGGLGYASLILNGTTADGGIRTITYKAVFAAQLIEELDMARKTVVLEDPLLTTVVDKHYASEKTVQKLKEELAGLPQTVPAEAGQNRGESALVDPILELSEQLEDEISSLKSISGNLSTQIRGLAAEVAAINQKPLVGARNVSVEVKTMEEVEGFDASIYARALERRNEEKAQRLEQERLLAEQKAQAETEAQNELQSQTQQGANATSDMIGQDPFGAGGPNPQEGDMMHVDEDNGRLMAMAGHLPTAEHSQIQIQNHFPGQAPNQVLNPDHQTHDPMQLPEADLDDMLYAMETDVLMAPGYADSFMAGVQSPDQLPPLPPMDASYMQDPGHE